MQNREIHCWSRPLAHRQLGRVIYGGAALNCDESAYESKSESE